MNWSSIENIEITYRLLKIRGFGPVKANKLLWSIRSSINSSEQYERRLNDILSPSEAEMFTSECGLITSDRDIKFISVLDERFYPERLKNLLKQNTPTILSYRGNIDLLSKPSVGFSGSRKVSEKGLWITRDSVTQLVGKGVCIISGYANGVDLEAHYTALRNGGSTIMVLPEGIEGFHIRKELKDVWDWDRILVISEFQPKEKWRVSHAMQRNQTIIGLSEAMFVVEAGETGGSIDAGIKAINMGKALFVPYYNEIPESASGNRTLIALGANKLLKNKENHTHLDSVIGLLHSGENMDGVLPLI